MNRLYKYTVWIALAALAGCTQQRDLYDVSHPMLYVEGDWMPSLGHNDLSQRATAMVYHSGDGVAAKEYFYAPNNVTVKLTTGLYDVLVFNSLMYSDQNTHLDGIHFRGTDHVDTFEAYARDAAANKRIGRADNEVIVTNEMEILTAASARVDFVGENDYFLKYRDGKNGYPTYPDYVESRIRVTPTPVTYPCKVTVNLTNPQSVAIANGALRGFAGSVYMSSRLPSHEPVSHHMRLNHMDIDPNDETKGTICSPEDFVTFGPPLDLPSRRYEFEICIVLINNDTRQLVFDVTDQVEPVIALLRQNLDQPVPVQLNIDINLSIDVALPAIDVDPGSIGVVPWDDEELIRVVIKP